MNQSQTDLRIQSFLSPYELLDAVSRGEVFDLFLLDILMPEITGIALGERLHQLLVDPLLIFLTSSEDYYSDAFRLYAFQYLCKPIQKNNLFSVLDKALTFFFKKKNDAFLLKTSGGLTRIPLHQIIYVELLSHICHFYLEDGQHFESQYLRAGFDCFLEPLLQHVSFVKTHTSYVVNLHFIEKLSGKTIPVARSYGKNVRQQYVAYGLRGEELL